MISLSPDVQERRARLLAYSRVSLQAKCGVEFYAKFYLFTLVGSIGSPLDPPTEISSKFWHREPRYLYPGRGVPLKTVLERVYLAHR
jgi:hypothetical protein